MIEIVKNGWILPSDDYLIRHKISGLDELEFTIPVDSDFYLEIDEETRVCETTENIYYKVKAIDAGDEDVTFLCQIDLDEWRGEILGNWNVTKTVTEDGVTKTIKAHDPWKIGLHPLSSILGWIRPSADWTYTGDLSKTDVRPLELPGPTRLDVALAAEEAFGVSLRFDNRQKVVTVIYPDDTPLSNSYAVRSVNLREIAYTGKSADFCTRLYPEGKNGLTIADANNGVPYLDNNTWSDSVVCGYFKDERFADPQSLKSAAEAELELRAMPARSWECDIVDLHRIDPETWKDMSMELLKRIRVIDDKKGISFTAYICEDEVYPYHPYKNVITISTVPGSIQNSIAAMRTSLTNHNSTWWQRNNSSSVTMVENGVNESNAHADNVSKEVAEDTRQITDLIAGNITPEDVNTTHLNKDSIIEAGKVIDGKLPSDVDKIPEDWIKTLMEKGNLIIKDGEVYYLGAVRIKADNIDVDSLFGREIYVTNKFQVDNGVWKLLQDAAGMSISSANGFTSFVVNNLGPQMRYDANNGGAAIYFDGEGTAGSFFSDVVLDSYSGTAHNRIIHGAAGTIFANSDGNHYLFIDTDGSESLAGSLDVVGAANLKGGASISGNPVADHIIERGTSGIYTYEKYASGTMKIWGVYEFSGVACTTAFGSATGWYRTGAISPPNYPVPFIEPPVLSYSWRSASAGYGAFIWRSDPGRTDRPNSVNLCRPGSVSSLKGYLEISAIGRWK